MPQVTANMLKMFRSKTVSSDGSNGGTASKTVITSGASSNLFRNATVDERTNGTTMYRKAFYMVDSAVKATLGSPRVWLDTVTIGSDRIAFCLSTQRETQAGMLSDANRRWYGAATLSASGALGATSVSVRLEDAGDELFEEGDLVRVTDKATPDSILGNEQWVRVAAPPVLNGEILTLTLSDPLIATFAIGSRVSSVHEGADILPSADNVQVSSASGVFDLGTDTVPLVELNNSGCLEQTWVISFTSATQFSIAGDIAGPIGTFSLGATIAPVNSQATIDGSPVFKILPAAFGGVWVSGDSVQFQTHHASIPVFLRRVVPPATQPVTNNHVTLVIDGETEE